MTEETELVILHPLTGYQFVREFVAPEQPATGMVTLAYTLDADGCAVREWAIYPTGSWVDGCENPPPDTGKKVQPETIALNTKTYLATGRTLNTKPKRLIERWASYRNNRPIVIKASSLLERLKAALR